MRDIPTSDDIERFRIACPANTPPEFIAFHIRHGAVKMDIESVGSGLVWLWPIRDVLQYSREYGFDEFAPGLLGIGSDGGGELYAIDVRDGSSGGVGDIPATSLQWEDFRQLASSFAEFADTLLAGTPIVEPDA
ncbi:SMI1/KNR4 family protein [Adhaeretor mobilis]|uniref:SMI1 / KNR4 family protein n=1 Tax=Adhaeretor mobilis TaxID=1930276 RepID=A0A517N2A2_9BACT|nr:SMI1/KNR4 family protein [Adhaeretor mobilis]QDT01255.1 SMI1 / KNR4 family protein [Adhaeretor mobilis]